MFTLAFILKEAFDGNWWVLAAAFILPGFFYLVEYLVLDMRMEEPVNIPRQAATSFIVGELSVIAFFIPFVLLALWPFTLAFILLYCLLAAFGVVKQPEERLSKPVLPRLGRQIIPKHIEWNHPYYWQKGFEFPRYQIYPRHTGKSLKFSQEGETRLHFAFDRASG